ncbi:MAG: WbqC family protein [Muribaculaceae bacterium]|nr:WbqC family protein [Muribaculaceae bacterium]
MLTPFTITPGWLDSYLKSRQDGTPDREARVGACVAAGTTGKSFARCRIASGGLTVPVEGGAHALKSARPGSPFDPPLSDHGKWRREHLGAWHATYSRTPYFAHLMPDIEQVYAASEMPEETVAEGAVSSGGISTLEEFNSALLGVVLSWLDTDALRTDPRIHRRMHPEITLLVEDDLSIFDLLFRIGPDALFALNP